MSKDKKHVFKCYSIFQYEKEQEYLSQMHAKGWNLTKVKMPGILYFEKCEPEEVVYQLDYNQGGTENKEEYVKMFEDCGWEHVLDFAEYCYFRKPVSKMQGKEEIFCDDDSRLDMMKRVIRGRVFILIPLFLGVVVPNLLRSLYDGDVYRGNRYVVMAFFGMCFILYMWSFIYTLVSYLVFKNKLGK